MVIVDPDGLHSHVDIGSAGAIAQRETLLGTAEVGSGPGALQHQHPGLQ